LNISFLLLQLPYSTQDSPLVVLIFNLWRNATNFNLKA